MNKSRLYHLFISGLLLICFLDIRSFAQGKIKKVGAGEYFTSYLTDDGKIFVTYWYGKNYVCKPILHKGIADVDGGQISNVALDSNGAVYILSYNNKTGTPSAQLVPLDNEGKPFLGNTKIFGWYRSYLSLRDGNIWIWGVDILNINQGENITAPQKLVTPKGKKISNLVTLTLDSYTLMALATDGSVWKYVYGSMYPIRIPLSTPAIKIAGIGVAAFVVETANDLLAWGYLGSYLGLKDLSNSPISIKSQWTKVGCKFPTKELIGNYNTLHIIDGNDNMFGAGENIQGEIGNGEECPSWINYKPNPYAWNWKHSQLISKPVQIHGKFKNLCTGSTLVFYCYVQDIGGNWYSWGRNKARCLGNGFTLFSDDEYRFPNGLDVPAPKLVTPLTVKWQVLSRFNPNIPKFPISNAGINQYINVDNFILNGSGSSQQNGKIVKYSWSKVSGPNCIIVDTLSKVTKVIVYTEGIYIYRLTVANTLGIKSTSDVSVFVSFDNSKK